MTDIAYLTVADHATITNGLVNTLNQGWTWTHSPLTHVTVIARAELPPSRLADQTVDFQITLRNADGERVHIPDPTAMVQQVNTVPGGHYPGAEIPFLFVFQYPPFELPPGRYAFHAAIDETARTYAFTVVPTTD